MAFTYKEFEELFNKKWPDLAAAFEASVRGLKSAVLMNILEEAIRRADVEGVINILQIDDVAFAPLARAVSDTFAAGAEFEMSSSITKRPPNFRRVIVNFVGDHPRARGAVQRLGAELIQEVSESVKQTVRDLVNDSIAAGRHPRTVALEIAGRYNKVTKRREGGVLGLTQHQRNYIENARKQIENLDPAYFKRELRDGRYDRTVKKAIKDGIPLPKDKVDEIVRRYEDRMLHKRAETIARTETISALNAGREEGFGQMAEKMGLPPGAYAKRWQSTPNSKRTRDSHRALNGKKVGPSEPFRTINGHLLNYPGDRSLGAPGSEIINCRCTVHFDVDWQMVAENAQ